MYAYICTYSVYTYIYICTSGLLFIYRYICCEKEINKRVCCWISLLYVQNIYHCDSFCMFVTQLYNHMQMISINSYIYTFIHDHIWSYMEFEFYMRRCIYVYIYIYSYIYIYIQISIQYLHIHIALHTAISGSEGIKRVSSVFSRGKKTLLFHPGPVKTWRNCHI